MPYPCSTRVLYNAYKKMAVPRKHTAETDIIIFNCHCLGREDIKPLFSGQKALSLLICARRATKTFEFMYPKFLR